MSEEGPIDAEWTIPAPRAQVWDVVSDPSRLPTWWPTVFVGAQSSTAARENGPRPGASYRLEARGLTPFKLNFVMELAAVDGPLLVEATTRDGLKSTWRMVLREADEGTRIAVTWRLDAGPGALGPLTPVLRPLFAWNQPRVLRTGEADLRAYVRQAASAGGAGTSGFEA